MKRIFLSIFMVICFFGSALAQTTYYIREGASGNGSTWDNALGSVPSPLQRGSTYYISDGTYGSYNFNAPASGSAYITIKKATITDHGTNTGWQNGYGDGQAVFSSSQISSTHWVIDGNTSCTDITNCTRGIKFASSGGLKILDFTADGNNNIQVKSVDVVGVGENELRGLYFCCGVYTDILISNVSIQNTGNDGLHLNSSNNIIFDRMYIVGPGPKPEGSGVHPDAIELLSAPHPGLFPDGKNILRNSIIKWQGQQFWVGAGSSLNRPSGAWDIYGNAFIGDCDSQPWVSCTGIKSRSEISIGPLNIYNNTFACLFNLFSTGPMSGVFQNNIVWKMWSTSSPLGGGFKSLSHNYNYYDSSIGSIYGESSGQAGGDIFINKANNGFRLASPTNTGASTPFPVDMHGNVRGADGVWDRGAYEYGGDLDPTQDTTPPTISSLAINSTSTSLINTASITASDNVAVTQYAFSLISTQPTAESSLWQSASTIEYVFPGEGEHTIFGWARDAAGNVSSRASATITIASLPADSCVEDMSFCESQEDCINNWPGAFWCNGDCQLSPCDVTTIQSRGVKINLKDISE